jgi:general secretion pathway protein D
VLGELFRTRSAKKTKSNLMVFIKPRILRDAAATTYETNQKYNYIREQQRVLGPRGEVLPLLPGEKPQMLPPLPEPAPAPVAAPVATPAAAPAEARPPADPSR